MPPLPAAADKDASSETAAGREAALPDVSVEDASVEGVPRARINAGGCHCVSTTSAGGRRRELTALGEGAVTSFAALSRRPSNEHATGKPHALPPTSTLTSTRCRR
jgi:hypothetical protein